MVTMYVLSVFGAMGTHLFLSGHLWRPDYYSIRTSSTTIDHATNCASRGYNRLYWHDWSLWVQRVAGTHNCCELNNYIKYQWYVREEHTATTTINLLSVHALAFFTLVIGRMFRVETLGLVKFGAVFLR